MRLSRTVPALPVRVPGPATDSSRPVGTDRGTPERAALDLDGNLPTFDRPSVAPTA